MKADSASVKSGTDLSIRTGRRIRPANRIRINMASIKNPFRSPRDNER
jgi:hypothetical protein